MADPVAMQLELRAVARDLAARRASLGRMMRRLVEAEDNDNPEKLAELRGAFRRAMHDFVDRERAFDAQTKAHDKLLSDQQAAAELAAHKGRIYAVKYGDHA